MLLLSRRSQESVMIGHDIEVKVIRVDGSQVQLGITAPRAVPVHRLEVFQMIQAENQAAAQAHPKDLPTTLKNLKKS